MTHQIGEKVHHVENVQNENNEGVTAKCVEFTFKSFPITTSNLCGSRTPHCFIVVLLHFVKGMKNKNE